MSDSFSCAMVQSFLIWINIKFKIDLFIYLFYVVFAGQWAKAFLLEIQEQLFNSCNVYRSL